MGKVKIITADQAAALVEDNTTVTTSGFVASGMPEALTKALEKRFLETGSPKNLTLFYAAAQGNRDGSGADHFAHEGMTKRVIGGHWNMVPTLGQLLVREQGKTICIVIHDINFVSFYADYRSWNRPARPYFCAKASVRT